MGMNNKGKLTLDDIGSFLSKLAEKSDHVYWLSSPDFSKIQYISPAYEKIWGRSRNALYAHPETWITFLHPEDAGKRHPILEMAEKIEKEGENARFSERYRIVRPNGEIRWIMDNGFPVFDQDGVCCGVTGIAIDITEEKELELQLQKAKEVAEIARAKAEAEQEMRKIMMVLVGGIVHDLRTPMATIRTVTSILADMHPRLLEMAKELKELGGKKHELLNKSKWHYLEGNTPITSLQSSITMMDDFIKANLIELANAEKAQGSGLSREDLSLCSSNRILENTLEAYPDLPDSINIHQDTAYDFYFMGNSILMMKVLFNLIKNAVEQITQHRNGIGEILITTASNMGNNFITIKDTGGGAPPEVVKNFFKGYFTTKQHGTGIGLAFCKKTLQSFGGDLTYNSIYGESMEFILSFPKLAG